jgi:small subunit ribosomal protein S3
MSKTVHPFSHRLVTLRDWKSRWFATDKKYRDFLKTDVLIRGFLDKRLRQNYIADVAIERNQKATRLIIKTSRPGMLIGRSGEGIEKLKKDIASFLGKKGIVFPADFKLDVVEVDTPEADAKLVAYMIVEGLEKRLPFRRVLKSTIEKVMATRGVEGARIRLGGRLGGAEIARTEEIKRGSIPLQTIRADVDFARERARMSYGVIGIKVWIYRGEVFSEKDKNTKQ